MNGRTIKFVGLSNCQTIEPSDYRTLAIGLSVGPQPASISWFIWWSHFIYYGLGGRAMKFDTTFNNISVISCWSVLLEEEIKIPVENHWPAVSSWQTLSHNAVLSTPTFIYHTITTTTAPFFIMINILYIKY